MNKNLTIALLAFAAVASGALAFWFAQERAAVQVRLE